MRRRACPTILGLAGVLLAGACGAGAGSDDASTCPSDLPGACPSPAPTYASDVAPIITARCASCHGPGGVEAAHDFTSYAGVYAERTHVLSQVYGCLMPPPSTLPLSASERQTLLAWLVCDAPP